MDTECVQYPEYEEKAPEHKPVYEEWWFWAIIIGVIVLIVVVIIILWFVFSPTVNSGSTVTKTAITFVSSNPYPIEVFPQLMVNDGAIVPAVPPIVSVPPGLSFTSLPVGDFIIFNRGGIKGVGVNNNTLNDQLIINTTTNLNTITMQIYELGGNYTASVSVNVTCTDNSINSTTVTVQPGSRSYIGITTSNPNIKNVVLQRTDNQGPFGISVIQFGVVNA